jgi:hypothetical protein
MKIEVLGLYEEIGKIETIVKAMIPGQGKKIEIRDKADIKTSLGE